MHNKRILFIAPRFHTNQFFLIKGLLERNVNVNFLSIYIGASENHKYLTPILSKPSIITNWFLKNRNPKYINDRKVLRKYHVTSFSQCISLYRSIKPDIVIIRNFRFFISIQHFIIGKLLGKKMYLYTLNNYREKISFRRKVFFKILGFLNIKHYTPVLGNRNESVIPNSTYIPMITEPMVSRKQIENKRKSKGIQIMTVGKMVERKNIKELLDSLYRINFFESKDNKFLIISECISEKQYHYLSSLREKIITNNDQIIFHLNITHEKVFELLKKSDLFVLPSHNEPAGTSLLEAMACGLGVVCSNSNGTKGYIREDLNGTIFTYTKTFEHLDVSLKKILHKELLINYGLSSLDLIKKHHSAKNFYEKIVENQRV